MTAPYKKEPNQDITPIRLHLTVPRELTPKLKSIPSLLMNRKLEPRLLNRKSLKLKLNFDLIFLSSNEPPMSLAVVDLKG